MMEKKKSKLTLKQWKVAVWCGIVLLILLFVDQITKAWAEAAADGLLSAPLSDYFLGFIRLDYVSNSGIAWSLFDDNPVAMTVITVFTGIMIVGIAILFFTLFKKNIPAQASLAVIEAGAIGNLIDRIACKNAAGHYVRDFIDVSRIGFGTCNVADFCITFGAVALVFIILFIGPSSLFPLTKKWREESKRLEEEKEKKKKEKNHD